MIYLICEGHRDGLDTRVLDAAIALKLNREVVIQPAGGEESLGSVATYLEERGRPKDRAYTIRDRNYRSSLEVEQTWANPQTKRFIWRRHEIENYLLDPNVIADAFASLNSTSRRIGGLRGVLPHTREEVAAVLVAIAQLMLEQHAGWLTHARLQENKNSFFNSRINGPPGSLRASAGSPFLSRQAWLDHLLAECTRIKGESGAFVASPDFDQAALTDLYDEKLAQVSAPEFFSSEQYINDMPGKELLRGLLNYSRVHRLPQLSQSVLETELIGALERRYSPNYFQPDDFLQLANICIPE